MQHLAEHDPYTHTDVRHISRANVSVQKVLDRQVSMDGDPGYCLAKRVRNQVYFEASGDLLCSGKGNQCSAGDCMRAATQVYAGDGKDGVPVETVRAMCMY